MKIYSSDSDTGVNGSGPAAAEEPEDQEPEDLSVLFNAPNYADFIKTAPNSKARNYEVRVQSMMKAGLIMSINNRQWADAATFLKHGPGFAKATGNLAAVDARAASIVEMLTAPESPYVMFALVAFPLFSQLARNHQPEIAEAGVTWRERRAQRKAERQAGYKKDAPPPVVVRLGKRRISIPVRVRFKVPKLRSLFTAFLAPSQHPMEITDEVLNDEGVVKALHKMGIYPRRASEDDE